MGRIKPHRGHTLYQYNKVTKELIEAKFEEQELVIGAGLKVQKPNKKVLVQENCIYVSALNKKNALKRINKYGL